MGAAGRFPGPAPAGRGREAVSAAAENPHAAAGSVEVSAPPAAAEEVLLMGVPVLIIGESGSGKTYAVKNLPPEEVAVIFCEKNRLPFKKPFKTYKVRSGVNEKGEVVRQAQIVYAALKRASKKIYVIDDSQYLMVNEFFDRMQEQGYQKFTEIGSHFRDVVHVVNDELPDDVVVYFLHHTDETASGKIKAKTIGRVLDDKLTLEGCFDIVLRAAVVDGKHVFMTQTDGFDTAKSPEDMFMDPAIPNDLAVVDAAIRDYYSLARLGSEKNDSNP